MKLLSGKEFEKVLKKNGWKLARIQGSHHIYIKKDQKDRISLPIHGNRDLKIGLLKHFMKVADIDESDL